MNIFHIIWIIGVLVYQIGIYIPRVRDYKRKERVALVALPGDIFLELTTWVFWQFAPFFYIFGNLLSFANYSLPNWASWLGVIIFGASLWLYGRAYADLGNNWSARMEILTGQTLVSNGVYAYIRHPVYAAMFLWAIAQPLLLHNWVAGFGLIILFTPLYLTRMPREEKMMAEHFGEAYKTYMQKTNVSSQ
ncbi:MAG: isoprenylcysteine carboxylmethyltransferase family protein [Anaerolineae bacterium]|jgi:protein-S-isoprenylcysteine O-methyltransferase Ste14|nr:isoprenylcysteine carboxylmethyltransferase family protein [Anaerolineae bacterium]MBT7071327.1 isoprenylcysteine carboxylmethyltransferase family protein [Anaerolineae bacterium]MBT7325827.1 isoprenylcysteine carboxylmethyltransferase family protein [Anaerolineae bacterium]